MLDRFGTPRLVQLTDINEPLTGEVNPTVLDRALQDASAEIDGYLVGRMAVPLLAPPANFRLLCCSIAHYRLLGSSADDVTQADYANAVAYLSKVATGAISIVAAADTPIQAGLGPVLFVTGQKAFARETDAFGGASRSGL
jgi:phage gp36-like protein